MEPLGVVGNGQAKRERKQKTDSIKREEAQRPLTKLPRQTSKGKKGKKNEPESRAGIQHGGL